MLSQEIRRKFLQYFKSQGHTIVPSSPVVPYDDPTLLFINAGMNQFKDVFLGKSKREYKKAATTQKCIRVGGKHNDLENVGHTSRHLTFFEMLGNFSFGDYFKKEAIGFAWDVSTHIFDFDPEFLWASVYTDDDESFELWRKYLSEKRIVRFGKEENFWTMGSTGPCGSCSELLYDRGSKYSDAASPIQDPAGERYLEFWNLVFMQYNRDEKGLMSTLPRPCVDTGAGLERILSLKMNVDSLFQTDILRGLISKIEEISKIPYDEKNREQAPAYHVIADHIRTLCFAMADGVRPGNIDRGYVLRKVLRRAVRYAKTLQIKKPFLARLVFYLVQMMGDDFPELHKARARIEEVLTLEEEAFLRTLERGGNILQNVMHKAKSEKKISGEDAFKLKDTYGFPIEEILLIAKDADLSVDLAYFQKLEQLAKEKSRKAQKCQSEEFDENLFHDFTHTHSSTEFIGYEKTQSDAKVLALFCNEAFVDEISQGAEGLLILDQTPFYAEMGGQVGDTGKIEKKGALFEVTDTVFPYTGITAHIGKVIRGTFSKQDAVYAMVDCTRREDIRRNHTATHLLHWALAKTLGDHIRQAGSLVAAERLRFDFNHHKALLSEEMTKIEELVNEKIREDVVVNIYEISYDQAQKEGEIKQFFGEKYGERTRVVDIDFSKELCAGTHVSRLGIIGFFKITKESSIAAGVRRIEAVSGKYAEKWVQQQEDLIHHLCKKLKASPEKLCDRLFSLVEENQTLDSELKKLRKLQIEGLITSLLGKKEQVGPHFFISSIVTLSAKELNPFADTLMQNQKNLVLTVATRKKRGCQVVIRISSDLIEKGLDALQFIQKIAPIIGGGGGGKKGSAQAGGTNPSKLEEAFLFIRKILESTC